MTLVSGKTEAQVPCFTILSNTKTIRAGHIWHIVFIVKRNYVLLFTWLQFFTGESKKCLALSMKYPYRVMFCYCTAGRTIFGGCETFRRWDLISRNRLPGAGLWKSRLPLQFWLCCLLPSSNASLSHTWPCLPHWDGISSFAPWGWYCQVLCLHWTKATIWRSNVIKPASKSKWTNLLSSSSSHWSILSIQFLLPVKHPFYPVPPPTEASFIPCSSSVNWRKHNPSRAAAYRVI